MNKRNDKNVFPNYQYNFQIPKFYQLYIWNAHAMKFPKLRSKKFIAYKQEATWPYISWIHHYVIAVLYCGRNRQFNEASISVHVIFAFTSQFHTIKMFISLLLCFSVTCHEDSEGEWSNESPSFDVWHN